MLARESTLPQSEPGVFKRAAPGRFTVGWRGVKLKVAGWIEPSETEVFLSLDGRIVAAAKAQPSARRPGKHAFRFLLGATVLKRAPTGFDVRVSSRLGMLTDRRGMTARRVESPMGVTSPTLFDLLSQGWTLNKWGQIALPISEKGAWKGRVLKRYVQTARFMEDRFAIRPFLVAGTLLGIVREGDLIAHDDDFDAGYFSRETTAEAVRDEMFAIIRIMREAGLRARPAHTRRFFKVGPGSSKLDFFPSWFENGHVWMPNSQMMSATADLMHPPREAEFLGRKVWLPNQPEAYLALHYGETWRTPDKHYREVKPPGVMDGLRRVQLTDDQMQAIGATPIVRPIKAAGAASGLTEPE